MVDKSERSRPKPRGRSATRQQPPAMSITELCSAAWTGRQEEDNDDDDDDTVVSMTNPTPPSATSAHSFSTFTTSQSADAATACGHEAKQRRHTRYAYQQQEHAQTCTQYSDSLYDSNAKEVNVDDEELGMEDLDVQLAARALGNMRHHLRTLSVSSSLSASSTTAAMNSPVACSPTPVLPSINSFPGVPPSLPSLAAFSSSTSAVPQGGPYNAHQQHLPDEPHVHYPEHHHAAHRSMQATDSEHFISRVSNIPLVSSALKVYEQSKANSNVVKYAAEGMESGVQKVWKPVVSKLEPRLGQLDEFACRQLDKLEQKFPSIMETTPTDIYTSSKKTVGDAVCRLLPTSSAPAVAAVFPGGPPQVHRMEIDNHGPSLPHSPAHSMSQPMEITGQDRRHGWQREEHEYEVHSEMLRRPQVNRGEDYQPEVTGQSQTHGPHYGQQQKLEPPERTNYTSYAGGYLAQGEQHSQPRSRWQHLLAGAGAAAGASAAAISEESMRCLKYCLQWLQYASFHIEHQIALLRSYLAHLSSGPSDSTTVFISPTDARTLSDIKCEVVETLRKVVEIVGRYAGAALPGEARKAVRSFILMLPSRWATLNTQTAGELFPIVSPMTTGSPDLPLAGGAAGASPGPGPRTTEGAHRVLTLAVESLVMLKSVAGIMGDTVQRAEAWVERLRIMGVTTAGASSNGQWDG